MNSLLKNKTMKIKIAAAIAVILILIIFGITKCIAGRSNRNVDISDYINVTYTGLESRGKATFVVDEDKLYQQLAGDEKNTAILAKMKETIDSVNIEASGNNLSNGDSVTVKVTYDKETAKKADCKFRGLKFSVKVSGLGEGKKIDIFENVEVVVAGVSPEAYANVTNNWTDENLKNISFSIDNPTHISKGDTVVVNCDASEDEMMERGYILDSFHKEFKVDNMNCYITDSSQIDMNLLKTIKSEAIETIKTETASLKFRMFYKATGDSAYLFQLNNEWVNNTEFVKAVYLDKKENAQANTRNYVYLFFKSNISNGSTTSDVYFAFEYTDGLMTTEDKFSISYNNQSSRYICGLSYENLYSSVILSKEGTYLTSEISGLND